jgi:hypothetical protein
MLLLYGGSRGRIGRSARWSDEEIDSPLVADGRNFYKVGKWTRNGTIDRMLYAGNNLGRCQRRQTPPRMRLTIRQRTRVLQTLPPQ